MLPYDFDLESLFRFAQRETVWDRLDEQQTYSRKYSTNQTARAALLNTGS